MPISTFQVPINTLQVLILIPPSFKALNPGLSLDEPVPSTAWHTIGSNAVGQKALAGIGVS